MSKPVEIKVFYQEEIGPKDPSGGNRVIGAGLTIALDDGEITSAGLLQDKYRGALNTAKQAVLAYLAGQSDE